MNGKKKIEITLTHDIDGVGGAGNTVWVVLDDVGGLEDSLNGAGFDIELVVAKAVLSRCSMLSARFKSAACKIQAWAQGDYLSSGEKFQSVTAP